MPPIQNPHFSRRSGQNFSSSSNNTSNVTSGTSSRSRSPLIPSTPTRRNHLVSRPRQSTSGAPASRKPNSTRLIKPRNSSSPSLRTESRGSEGNKSVNRANFQLPAIPWPNDRERLNGNSTVFSSEPTERLRTILRIKSTIKKKLDKTPKLRVTFRDLNEDGSPSSIIFNSRVETFVPQILQYLNWYEILTARLVCKKWADLVASESSLCDLCGVPTIRKSFDHLEVFNVSQFIFTEFRLLVNSVFDFTRPTLKKFFSKHGPRMNSLEIRNRGMTLAALVYILDKCPNLTFLSISWCPEMYAFNTDLLRKYYGTSFRLGGLSRLTHLKIDKSCFLTDTALNSLLKWTGSNLKNLSLTCPHAHSEEEKSEDVVLNALKPRWTFAPLLTYILRFPNLDLLIALDFTGGNVTSEDLIYLAKQEKMKCITSLNLTSTKVEDKGLNFFLVKNGANIQKLILDHTAITDRAFISDEVSHKTMPLPKLQILSLNGTKGIYRHLHFWKDFINLNSLYISNTSWFNFTSLLKPAEKQNHLKNSKEANKAKELKQAALAKDLNQAMLTLTKERHLKMKKLHLNDNVQLGKMSVDSKVVSSWFSSFCSALANLSELDLSEWGCFMRDENFVLICSSVPCLELLKVRGWKELSDGAVTGFDYLNDDEGADLVKPFVKGAEKKEFTLAVGYISDKNGNGGTKKIRNSIGSLQFLKTLDLSGCVRLTDNSIRLGLSNLRNLRKLGLENLKVTDEGIEHLLKYAKKLDQLNLKGCKGVTKEWTVERSDGFKINFSKF